MRDLNVSLPAVPGSYGVRVGSGLTGALTSFLQQRSGDEALVLIADATVARLHADNLAADLKSAGFDPLVLTFPSGESSKTRASKQDLEDRMLAAGLGRDTLVLALGGGVTIDLAGFVAATYMRGVPFVALPTTTLAMVDSAVGGKTGINVTAGKNLVGAFHRPEAVFCDIARLVTLPDVELRIGLAEVVKHGLIASVDHFTDVETCAVELLSRDPSTLERVIGDSIAVKISFVERDEKEAGARKALNFGHTFAHALEKMSGWSVAHGEAVARGLVFEARLSVGCGLLEEASVHRIASVLAALELPSAPFRGLDLSLRPGLPGGPDQETFLAATRTDKKARGGSVEWVLLEDVGQVVDGWTRSVADDEVAAAIETFTAR